MNYKGDISPNFQPKFYRPGGNLFVRYNAGRAISFKVNLLIGRLFAEDGATNDPQNIVRNRSFRTNIVELAPQFEYNFLNYRNEKTRQNWSPYLFAGLGVFYFNAEDSNHSTADGIQVSIPFGVGIKYVLGGNWNLGLEFGARKTFTDYLDALGGPLTNSKIQNGNPNTDDMYFYTGLMVSYTFYKVYCPEFY